MQQVAQAVVLRRIPYGESDFIVTMLTPHAGKVSGLARAARRSKKRFGGALEPGNLIEVEYAFARGGDLVRLQSARLMRSAAGMLKSLERMAAMHLLLELALVFVPEYEPACSKFELLSSQLDRLVHADPTTADMARWQHAWLVACGFAPVLDRCVVSSTPVADEGRWSYDVQHGGLIATHCGEGIRLTPSVLRCLRSLSHGNDVSSEEQDWRIVQQLLERSVHAAAGRRLRSQNIW